MGLKSWPDFTTNSKIEIRELQSGYPLNTTKEKVSEANKLKFWGLSATQSENRKFWLSGQMLK